MFNMEPDKLAKLFIQISVFGLVIAVWLAVIAWWMLRRGQKQRKLERRLQFAEQGEVVERVIRLWHDGQAVDTFVPENVKMSPLERLERMRQDAGWKSPMPKVLAMLTTFTAIASVTAWFLSGGRLLPVFGIVCIIFMCFRMSLLSCINRRAALFEKQLVEALDLGGRSLRAGHPLSGAFKLIATEIGAPVSTIFSDIIEQEALGVSLSRALYNSSQKSRSPDMKIFATSVCIQLRSGGNLADMIDRVAWVVRERMRLSRRARVLTAEAQLSKWVLLALPIGMFALLNIINPEYMEPFFTTFLGKIMLLIALGMLAIGTWIMNKMSQLTY
jgi:tight adherence protein B